MTALLTKHTRSARACITDIKITARQYTVKLLHFVFFKSHLCESSHTCWQKYIPGITLTIKHKNSPGKINSELMTTQSRELGTKLNTYSSFLEINCCAWFIGGGAVIYQPLSLFYLAI